MRLDDLLHLVCQRFKCIILRPVSSKVSTFNLALTDLQLFFDRLEARDFIPYGTSYSSLSEV